MAETEKRLVSISSVPAAHPYRVGQRIWLRVVNEDDEAIDVRGEVTAAYKGIISGKVYYHAVELPLSFQIVEEQ